MFCPNCGASNQEAAVNCAYCGASVSKPSTTLNVQATPATPPVQQTSASNTQALPDLSSLKPYYQVEFRKIFDSKESYIGKWNWAAFFFGVIWAMTKGLWRSALVWIVIAIVSAGWIGWVAAFYFGFRGNYLYYKTTISGEQPWF
jgi:hypothetical protein